MKKGLKKLIGLLLGFLGLAANLTVDAKKRGMRPKKHRQAQESSTAAQGSVGGPQMQAVSLEEIRVVEPVQAKKAPWWKRLFSCCGKQDENAEVMAIQNNLSDAQKRIEQNARDQKKLIAKWQRQADRYRAAAKNKNGDEKLRLLSLARDIDERIKKQNILLDNSHKMQKALHTAEASVEVLNQHRQELAAQIAKLSDETDATHNVVGQALSRPVGRGQADDDTDLKKELAALEAEAK